MNYNTFRERMSRDRVTGAALARVAEVSQSAMNSWLTAGKPMPADVIRSIALYMDMDPHEIARELLGMQVEEPRISLEVAAHIWADALKAEIGANVPQKGN